jgi:hypothetical protein
MHSFWATEIIFTGTRTQDKIHSFGLCFCDLLAKTNNSRISTLLLLCLVFKLQKPSSPGLEPRTFFFQSSGHCSYNLLFETNNFDLDAVFLSCLLSELQEPTLTATLHLRTTYQIFYFFEISFWFKGISMPGVVHISISVFELQANIHMYPSTVSVLCVTVANSNDVKLQGYIL